MAPREGKARISVRWMIRAIAISASIAFTGAASAQGRFLVVAVGSSLSAGGLPLTEIARVVDGSAADSDGRPGYIAVNIDYVHPSGWEIHGVAEGLVYGIGGRAANFTGGYIGNTGAILGPDSTVQITVTYVYADQPIGPPHTSRLWAAANAVGTFRDSIGDPGAVSADVRVVNRTVVITPPADYKCTGNVVAEVNNFGPTTLVGPQVLIVPFNLHSPAVDCGPDYSIHAHCADIRVEIGLEGERVYFPDSATTVFEPGTSVPSLSRVGLYALAALLLLVATLVLRRQFTRPTRIPV